MTPLPATPKKRRLMIWVLVGSGLLFVLGANAHLVFVAVTSQPDCVAHVQLGEATSGGQFGAAESACRPKKEE